MKQLCTTWKGIELVKGLLIEKKDGREKTSEEILAEVTNKQTITEIQKHDHILAEMVSKLQLDPQELQVLVELKDILERHDTPQAVQELSHPEKFQYFENQLLRCNDTAIAENLKQFMSYIRHQHEEVQGKVSYLERFLRDIHNWRPEADYLANYEEYVKNFISALQHRETGEGALAEALEQRSVIRELKSYRELLTTLSHYSNLIEKGIQDEHWKPFEEFVIHLDKEANALHHLGDEETASLLRKYKKEGYYYQLWSRLIGKQLAKKRSREEIERVIAEAQKELKEVILKRIQLLNAGVTPKAAQALESLKKQLDKRVSGIKNGKKMVEKIVSLRTKNLEDENKALLLQFAHQEDLLYQVAQRFEKANDMLENIQKLFEEVSEEETLEAIKTVAMDMQVCADQMHQNMSMVKDVGDANVIKPISNTKFLLNRLEARDDELKEHHGRVIEADLAMPIILKEIYSASEAYQNGLTRYFQLLRSHGFSIPLPGNLRDLRKEEREVIRETMSQPKPERMSA